MVQYHHLQYCGEHAPRRARTYWGLRTRLGAKSAAFNLAVYVKHLFNRPPFAIFDPLG